MAIDSDIDIVAFDELAEQIDTLISLVAPSAD